MKLYKKSDLSTIDGLLVASDGSIVMPSLCIIDQANDLETMLQKALFLREQPKATPAPTLDGFDRKSVHDVGVKFTSNTPTLDEKTDEAMRIMREMDDMSLVDDANRAVDMFSDFIKFVKSDNVVSCDWAENAVRFDTPTLGDPLQLTEKKIMLTIATIVGMDFDGVVIHLVDDEDATASRHECDSVAPDDTDGE